MFQYPGQFAYQIPSIARANLQVLLNVTGRFASGLQALTELNVQTVRKVVEESNALLRAGDEAGAGDVLGWQSVMFAQLPQKAASYSHHALSIITSTQDDMIGEVRNQYERNGIKLGDMAKAATDDVRTAAESSGELIANLADTASDAARDTSATVLDASGEIAKTTRASAKRSV
ncbi:phasin family protein [Caballeronia sp. LZ029]|uniref:phasin family protein n=1 Tax=Caballeronia sp. LZ029 TaxID=3038564 RepID=UPI00068B6BE4|nr:phasin family protein [Caballeronia sp. LZ029]MDR5744845.1 phasin family protein [Caballeronia sp. LZ029]